MIDRIIQEATAPLSAAGIDFLCCADLEKTAEIANSHSQYTVTDGRGNNILHALALAGRGNTMYELLEKIDVARVQVLMNMRNSDGMLPQEACKIYSHLAYKEL